MIKRNCWAIEKLMPRWFRLFFLVYFSLLLGNFHRARVLYEGVDCFICEWKDGKTYWLTPTGKACNESLKTQKGQAIEKYFRSSFA